MLDDALRYALERKQFGQPIAEFQLIQAMLADSRAETYAARAMVLDAARRRDAGEDVGTEAACCKLFASEMCGRVADRAVQIHGGAGYVADYGIERFYRDVRLFRIYEGTSADPAAGDRARDDPRRTVDGARRPHRCAARALGARAAGRRRDRRGRARGGMGCARRHGGLARGVPRAIRRARRRPGGDRR